MLTSYLKESSTDQKLLDGQKMDSYDSFPQVPSEDVVLGTPEGRNLSPVRRFFCLLVTFDFLFTVLLWTLCVILVKGEDNIIEAFKFEIISYSLKISIFDTVMCAGSRFVILILFYALLQCRHWLPVALTTAGSCAFLLSKVFMFEWSLYGSGSPWPVLLVLSSFVISWSEAWFLDFRVVPIERQAEIYLSRQTATFGGNRIGVVPWLRDSVAAQSIRNQMATPGGFQSYPESVSNFYSPLESPYNSDNENEGSTVEAVERRRRGSYHDSPECKLWILQGPQISLELVMKVRSPGWILEKAIESGDTVFSQMLHRKIFKISGSFPVPPVTVVNELFHKVECMPNWSPAVSHCHIIQKLNDMMDVSYSVSKEGAGGVISPRDFVTLRHHQVNGDGTHVLAMVSVKHENKPTQAKIIRGTNGINGWFLSPAPCQLGHTEFHWVLDADLQLNRLIPNKIIDSAIMSSALETVRCLRHKLTFEAPPSGTNGLISHIDIDPEPAVITGEGAA